MNAARMPILIKKASLVFDKISNQLQDLADDLERQMTRNLNLDESEQRQHWPLSQ